MSPENQAWADRLARSLSEWLKKNGYAHMGGKKEFADEHGIDPTIFGRITLGRVISDDVANYARIYLATGLSESRPTDVPAKRVITSGREVLIQKRWTHEQYTRWVIDQAKVSKPENRTLSEEQVKKWAARRPSEAINNPERSQEAAVPAPPQIGSLVEQILAFATQQIADAVAERLSSKSDSLGELLEKLTAELQRYYTGSKADRDRLAKEHGRRLAALLPLLETLTLNADARERAIQLATMTDRSL